MKKPFFKRALAAVGVIAVVAGVAPLLTASPAVAAGTLVGPAPVRTANGGAALASGNSSTVFTLRPSSPACAGDSTNDGYRWQGYIVSGAIDPATLRFGDSGPVFPNAPNTGTYATFQQPLYDTNGSPVTNMQTADASPVPGPGPILSIPTMNFAVLAPGDVPSGVYNVGVACTLGPASSTQMQHFWNTQLTVLSRPGSGAANFIWKVGDVQAAPDAPTMNSAVVATDTASTGKVSLGYTILDSNPANSDCAVLVGTTPGGTEVSGLAGQAVPCASSSADVTGLAYGVTHYFRVKASNSIGSATSNELSGVAIRPAVTGLTATPGASSSIALNWADAPLLAPGEVYRIVVANVGTFQSSTSNITFNGSPGSSYTFTVTYGAVGTSLAASKSATAKCNKGAVSALVSNTLPPLEPVACLVGGLGL